MVDLILLTYSSSVWRVCYILNKSNGRALVDDDKAVLIGLLKGLLRVWVVRSAETVGTEPFQQLKVPCQHRQVQPATAYLQHPATPCIPSNEFIHHTVNTSLQQAEESIQQRCTFWQSNSSNYYLLQWSSVLRRVQWQWSGLQSRLHSIAKLWVCQDQIKPKMCQKVGGETEW